MKYSLSNVAITQVQQDIVITVFEDSEFSANARALDQLSQNYLTQLVNAKEISGKQGEVAILRDLPNIQAKRVFLVGCGKKNELNERQFKQIVSKLITVVNETQSAHVVIDTTEIALRNRDFYWHLRFAVETIEECGYLFEQFKSKKTEKNTALKEVSFYIGQAQRDLANQAIQQAVAIANGVKIAKDLSNMPANVCNPNYLAEQAKKLAETSPLLQFASIDEEQMAELGMNSYLAVSQGSRNEAKMSILTYKNHPNPNAKPIVLVGKGLTFDAGGISLKPAEGMDEMKYDMCGAASVFGVMNALTQLELPLNVIGVLAGCENLPGGNAYRPGDILTTMAGLTVEVLNTDAEGRLVLCDALTYVERFKPELVIDIATLTGACVVALGAHHSGLMSTDDDLAKDLLEAAEQAHDKAWHLPLGEEYQEQLKSNFADLANIGGRWGGAITAGAFLSNFTKKYRWAHLDIAGTAWLQGENKGATGRPVRLLMQFLLNQIK